MYLNTRKHSHLDLERDNFVQVSNTFTPKMVNYPVVVFIKKKTIFLLEKKNKDSVLKKPRPSITFNKNNSPQKMGKSDYYNFYASTLTIVSMNFRYYTL